MFPLMILVRIILLAEMLIMQGLLKAKVNNIDLSFDQACALDLQDKYK